MSHGTEVIVIPSHLEQTRKLCRRQHEIPESSISFMFSISISNITWIWRKTNQTVTTLSDSFCHQRSRITSIRSSSGSIQSNSKIPRKTIECMKRILFDQRLTHDSISRVRFFCFHIHTTRQKVCDAFDDLPLSLIQLSIYIFSLETYASEIIFTVGFHVDPSLFVCSGVRGGSICMCCIIIVTFCHKIRLIFRSHSLHPAQCFRFHELIWILGLRV